MSLEFADTTARIEYLPPEEVADLDHCDDGSGLAGLAIGGADGVLLLGTPAELRSWLHCAPDAALPLVPGPPLDTASSASRQHVVLPQHSNDLGDWCPFSGCVVEAATGCPQDCRAVPGMTTTL